MKKISSLTAAVLLLLTLAGCSNAGVGQSATGDTQVTDPAPSKDEWSNYLSYEVSEFSVSKAECSYSDGSLEVLVKFKNISERPIAAVDAAGTVNDVFGEKKIGVNLSVAKKIAPGASANAGSWGSSCYSLNSYSADESSLLEADPETLKLVVEVSKIAFVDGEIIEF